MKLYHYTATHLAASIMKEGITRGMVPEVDDGGVRFYNNLQWLTVSEDWDQTWCRNGTLPYDRTAVRFTVTIPKTAEHRLIPWRIFSHIVNDQLVATLNSFGDPENWYLYRGRIKPGWIRKMEYKRDAIRSKMETSKQRVPEQNQNEDGIEAGKV